MGQAVIHYCDECPNIKGAANHWRVIQIAESPVLHSYEKALELVDSEVITADDLWMLCSDSCFMKAMNRWIDAGHNAFGIRRVNVTRSFVDIRTRSTGHSGHHTLRQIEGKKTPTLSHTLLPQNPNPPQLLHQNSR